jgi:hypothetical protein
MSQIRECEVSNVDVQDPAHDRTLRTSPLIFYLPSSTRDFSTTSDANSNPRSMNYSSH